MSIASRGRATIRGHLEVRDLATHFPSRRSVVRAVDGVDLEVLPGESLGLVGESGCGKSVTALSIAGLVPSAGRRVRGSVVLDGRDISHLREREWRRFRGKEIGFVFQDPVSSLNPRIKVGEQIAEVVRIHERVARREAQMRAVEAMASVKLPHPRERYDDYPHQLSGGMSQRVMIAMAIVCRPAILIADEPTTALDVTTQADVLGLLADLQQESGMSLLLISHDIGVVREICDRVVVMYAGRIVETGDIDRVLASPRHPYTFSLLRCVLRGDTPWRARLPAIEGAPPNLRRTFEECRFVERCDRARSDCALHEPVLTADGLGGAFACFFPISSTLTPPTPEPARAPAPVSIRDPRHDAKHAGPADALLLDHVSKDYRSGESLVRLGRSIVIRAVSDVTLRVTRGETFGLVGETGAGKSTLGKIIAGLEIPTHGAVQVAETLIASLRGAQLRDYRRSVHIVFQEPYASFDPRLRVGSIVGEPLEIHQIGSRRDRSIRIADVMEMVGLDPHDRRKYPHEFSGGQLQRIGLARGLVAEPALLVLDEPVSALDLSIRAQITNLLLELQNRTQTTYFVISHDLLGLKHISDRVGVMYAGRLVEVGPSEDIYRSPAHHYTAQLIASVPTLGDVATGVMDTTRGVDVSAIPVAAVGCPFHLRCPAAQGLCRVKEPVLTESGNRAVACHFPRMEP